MSRPWDVLHPRGGAGPDESATPTRPGSDFVDHPAVVKCHEPWLLRGVDGV